MLTVKQYVKVRTAMHIHFSLTLFALVFAGIYRVLLRLEFPRRLLRSSENADVPHEALVQFLQVVLVLRHDNNF